MNHPPLLRSWKQRLRRWHRDRVLVRAVAELSALDGAIPRRELLERLIYGFANEGWAATIDLLDELANRLTAARSGYLECGSGSSTLLAAALTARRRTPVVSLESDGEWFRKMQCLLSTFGFSHVSLQQRELVDHGEFAWYRAPDLPPDRKFDLVLCDGPPGETKGGRYGLLPCMKDRLTKGCVLIVDDTHRPEDDAVVERWLAELSGARRTRRANFSILETA